VSSPPPPPRRRFPFSYVDRFPRTADHATFSFSCCNPARGCFVFFPGVRLRPLLKRLGAPSDPTTLKLLPVPSPARPRRDSSRCSAKSVCLGDAYAIFEAVYRRIPSPCKSNRLLLFWCARERLSSSVVCVEIDRYPFSRVPPQSSLFEGGNRCLFSNGLPTPSPLVSPDGVEYPPPPYVGCDFSASR